MELIGKMKTLVEKQGGKHIQITNWGRKKLAWERKKLQKGMYVHHHYLGDAGIVKEYERTLSIDESVVLRQSVLLNRSIDPATVQPGVDVIEPPITKEPRREDRYDARERDGYEERDDGPREFDEVEDAD
jgi:small subunit ribosomal protein S6